VHGEGRRSGCTQDALSRRVQIERAVQRQKFGHHRRGRALFVIFCCDMLPDASAHVESCREGCCRQVQIAGRQLEDAATARSQRGDDDRLCGPLPSRLHHAQPGVMKATRISEQHRHCLRERAPRPRPGRFVSEGIYWKRSVVRGFVESSLDCVRRGGVKSPG